MTENAAKHLGEGIDALLDQREAEVTRAVTDAVTADLEKRFHSELAARNAEVKALEDELVEVHEQLHEARRELDRILSHPAVRGGRWALRFVRTRVGRSARGRS